MKNIEVAHRHCEGACDRSNPVRHCLNQRPSGLLRRFAPRNDKGFSLIELLVVLLIIGIVITAALLAFGNTLKNRQIQNAAAQFAELLPMAEEQAILKPEVYGLVINAKGYGFDQIEIQNGKQQWEAITDDSLLQFRPWPSGTKINLQVSKQSPFPMTGPEIIISSSGELTAFSLQIGGDKPLELITVYNSGAVTEKKL